MALKNVGLV